METTIQKEKQHKLIVGVILVIIAACQIPLFLTSDLTVKFIIGGVMVSGFLGMIYIGILNYKGRGKKALLAGLIAMIALAVLVYFSVSSFQKKKEEIDKKYSPTGVLK